VPVVASSGAGGTTQEQVDLNPASSSIGTGLFTVHVVYFANAGADQYHGAASVVAAGSAPVPAPTPTSGIAPRYENFTPPEAGPGTLGRSSGEPSIGIGLGIAGHPEGRAMFQSDVQTLRVTFNGACAKPLWENKPAPTSQVDFDPILFTDLKTGRTIVSLLSSRGTQSRPRSHIQTRRRRLTTEIYGPPVVDLAFSRHRSPDSRWRAIQDRPYSGAASYPTAAPALSQCRLLLLAGARLRQLCPQR